MSATSTAATAPSHEEYVAGASKWLADSYCQLIRSSRDVYAAESNTLTRLYYRTSQPNRWPPDVYPDDGGLPPAAAIEKLCKDAPAIAREFVAHPDRRDALSKAYPGLIPSPTALLAAGDPYRDVAQIEENRIHPPPPPPSALKPMPYVSGDADTPQNTTTAALSTVSWLALNPLIPLALIVIVAIVDPKFRHILTQVGNVLMSNPQHGPAKVKGIRFKNQNVFDNRGQQLRVRATAMILAPVSVFCTCVVVGKFCVERIAGGNLSLIPVVILGVVALVAGITAISGPFLAARIAWMATAMPAEVYGPTRSTQVFRNEGWNPVTQGADPTARERHGDQPHATHSGPVRTIAERDLHTGALSDKIIGDPRVTPPPAPKTTSGEKGTAKERTLDDLRKAGMVIDGDEL